MTAALNALRAAADAFVPPCLEAIEALVTLESPSGDAERVERVAVRFAEELERRGVHVARAVAPGFGVNLIGRLAGAASSGRPLLIVGHLDTVHPVGTLARMPFSVDGDRVTGPGVYDMKGGLAVALTALDLLRDRGLVPARDVLFLVTCDEEIGSGTSRALLEEKAREAFGALVLEPCVLGGAAKTRRKGVGGFGVEVRGLPAHAGIEPEAGASAIHELTGLLDRIRALADPAQGTTINVGVIEGGTRSNVVAERARAEVDLRVWTAAEGERVARAVRALAPANPRCTVEIAGGINRGALERTEASGRLFESARRVAAAQGWDLSEGSTGGASDGNLLSAAGCATLDGLGPDGGGAHALDEHVRRSDIAPRIALLAGLLARL